MSATESIQQLYIAFKKVFKRPTSFYNEHCCVTKENELILLTTSLSELTEQQLSMPIDHYGSCFGTFREVSYYVPRLIELLSDSSNGFEYGNLCFSFYRLLRDGESEYQRLGVWDQIEKSMFDNFYSRTSKFDMIHFNEVDCKEKGWVLQYFDMITWPELLDELLGEFFYPILSKRKKSAEENHSEWDLFIEKWAEDKNPHRICYLLDAIKQYND
jgi:hypothetical protein